MTTEELPRLQLIPFVRAAPSLARPLRGSAIGLHAIACALGLVIVSLSYAGARVGDTWVTPVYWLGLFAIFLPTAWLVFGVNGRNPQRLWILVAAALALYLVKVLFSPGGFGLHDELGQARSVQDILRSGRLLTPNPVVEDYGFYPALISVTAALSRLSGLGIFASGMVVVGVARVLLVGALFCFVRRVTKSGRLAGVAVLVYFGNPNFAFFDAQFAYESLALGLAALALWLIAEASLEPRDRTGVAAVALIVLAGLVLSHHLTSYAIAVLVIVWWLASLTVPDQGGGRRLLFAAALSSVAVTVAWGLVAWHSTAKDIGGSLTGSITGLINFAEGKGGGHAPFTEAKGYTDPLLERATGLVAVALLIAHFPWGLIGTWLDRRRAALMVVLGLVTLAYPVTLALRLTAAGTETSNRASEFVFVGLGVTVAIAFGRWGVSRVDREHSSARVWRMVAVVIAGVVFAGGITVGWPGYELTPGRYLVEGGPRSIDPQGLAAAHWAGRNLRRGSTMIGDTVDSTLMAAYGGLDPVRPNHVTGTTPYALFFSQRFGSRDRAIVRADHIRYIVVDRRLSLHPPREGRYFDTRDDAVQRLGVLTPDELAKFGETPDLDPVYDTGDVIIYSTAPVVRGGR